MLGEKNRKENKIHLSIIERKNFTRLSVTKGKQNN